MAEQRTASRARANGVSDAMTGEAAAREEQLFPT